PTTTPKRAWSRTRRARASTAACSARWWSNARTACASASARASPTRSAPRRRRSAASSPIATTACRAGACPASRDSCTCATNCRHRTRAECVAGAERPGARGRLGDRISRAPAGYAIMGRPPPPMSMTIARYRFGDYVLDLPKHELLHRGDVVALPARVFERLCCLIEHRDRAVSRDELVQAVFARSNVSDAQLAQVVLRSRRAVGDDGQEQHTIRTVPRYGFRWRVEVRVETAADEPAVAPATPARVAQADGQASPRPATTAAPAAADTGAVAARRRVAQRAAAASRSPTTAPKRTWFAAAATAP